VKLEDRFERAILDPVMRREVFGVSHRPTSYAFRAAYVLMLAGVLYIIWNFVEAGTVRSAEEFARAGNSLFAWFSFVQFALAVLSGMVLGADLLPRETRSRTLELLLVSPLKPATIVWGKWKACAAFLLLVIFSSAPVLSITVYMGGVAPVEFIGVYAVTIVWGLLAASISLYYSTRFESAYATVGMSGFLMVMYLLFTPCLAMPLQAMAGRGGSSGDLAGAWIHPLFSIYGSIYGKDVLGLYGWVGASTLGAGFTAAFVGMTVGRVGSPWRREAAAMSREASFAAPGPSAAGGNVRHGRSRWLAHALGDRMLERNPLLWKELQWRSRSGFALFVRVALIVLGALSPFFLLIYVGGVREDLVLFIVWSILAGLWPAAAISGAEAFTSEKERNMWEVLMATPLTGFKIVWAKLASRFFRGVAPFMLMLAGALGLAGLTWGGGWDGLGFAFVAHAVFAVFLNVLGAFASLIASRTRTALAVTLLVVFVAVGLLSAVGRASRLSGSPYPMVEMLEQALSPVAFHDAIRRYDAGDTIKVFGPGLAVFLATYGGGTALMLALMLMRPRELGRRYLG
jgi:ABC-type transport system involved in multi-copper enzyme maturation permease subunit